MARQPGRRNDGPAQAGGWLFGLGRMVGFILLSGSAMVVLAAVVLLPPYAKLAQSRYELACADASINDADLLVRATQRLIEALPQDPVLAKRLAMSQSDLTPSNERVIVDPSVPPLPPPDMVIPVQSPRPAPPSGLMIEAASRISNPATRRGLLFLSATALLAGMFLFASPDRYAGRKHHAVRR